jgi:osmotically-inducible protein OsmY
MRFLRALLLSATLVYSALAAGPPTDDEIYDKVRISLANDRDVKGGAIEVLVIKGVVELRGTVRREKQKEKAEKAARKVKGVQRVVNNLKIAPV